MSENIQTYTELKNLWSTKGLKQAAKQYELGPAEFATFFESQTILSLSNDLVQQLELEVPVAAMLAETEEYLELLNDSMSMSFRVQQDANDPDSEVLACILHPDLLEHPDFLISELAILLCQEKAIEKDIDLGLAENPMLHLELLIIYLGYGSIVRNCGPESGYFTELSSEDLNELLGVIEPSAALVAFNEAEQLYQENKPEEAIQTMLAFVREVGEDVLASDAYNNAGFYAMANKEFGRAKSFFESALDIDPNFQAVQDNLFFLEMLQGKIDPEKMEQLKTLEEFSDEQYRNLGMYEALQGNWEEAKVFFEEAVSTDDGGYLYLLALNKLGEDDMEYSDKVIWREEYDRLF